MRVFVLATLSTSAIAASNNAGKLPAKSNATDNKNAADSSPFGVMLAATAALQEKTQAAKPVSGEDHHAAVKKNSDAASNDAPAAPKDQRDAAAAQTSPAKASDSKDPDTKPADTKSADGADGKAPTKDIAAANNNNGADQTAQAQPQPAQQPPAQQSPVQQPPVQQPQVPPPLPDPNALALAQAQAGAQPGPQIAAPAANDDADAGANVGAVGADSAKTSPAAAAASPPASIPDIAGPAAANGAAPQSPGARPAGNGKSFAGQSKVSDSKLVSVSVSGNDAKLTAQSDSAAPQTQTPAPQAQTASQTPPPAAPATNAAAVPSPNFGTPVQNSPATAVSNTVQISAHGANTATTVNTLAVAIAARTQSGARQFDIRLDPPELGRVEVRLSIDASGKTEAHMTADRPETLNLLQRDSGSLTQALRDAGLDVSNSGLNFSLRGQNGQSGDTGPERGPRANLTASRAIDAVQGAATAMSFTGGIQDGRLDIHV